MRASDYQTPKQAEDYAKNRFSGGLKIVSADEEAIVLNWFKQLNTSAESNLIDLGAGTGRGSEILLKTKPRKIYAVDRSKAMLNFLKNKFRKEISQNKISLIEGASDDFKIADESIDSILSLHLFKHLSNISPTLVHLNKSLKQDGFIVFDVLNKNSLVNLNLDTCFALNKSDVTSKLKKSGFNQIKITSFHFFGETIYKLLPYQLGVFVNLIDKTLSFMNLPLGTKFLILAKKE